MEEDIILLEVLSYN